MEILLNLRFRHQGSFLNDFYQTASVVVVVVLCIVVETPFEAEEILMFAVDTTEKYL